MSPSADPSDDVSGFDPGQGLRVLLVTTGSRGDVEPFVALAVGLQDSGHSPILAAPTRFAAMARERGVAFRGLDDSLLDLQDDLAGAGALRAISGAAKARVAFEQFLADVADLVGLEPDIVVYHPKTLATPMVAERLGVPAVAAQLIPLYQPTHAFPAPVLTRRVPGWLNRASWTMVSAIEVPWRRTLRRIRGDRLGLAGAPPGLRKQMHSYGSLNAWSPRLLPAPAEWPATDRPVGFWRLPPSQWQPPAGLVDFLDSGDRPIYVGFGSMTAAHPDRFGETIVHGLRTAGRRAVVARGSGALVIAPSDDIFVVDQVPHDWLLPRVAAAVHHGGVGTVAAALSAGVPQVIKPFLGDQHFWSRRTAAIGVAADLGAMTPGALSAAIRTTISAHTHRAQALGEEIRQESGIATAVGRLELVAERHRA